MKSISAAIVVLAGAICYSVAGNGLDPRRDVGWQLMVVGFLTWIGCLAGPWLAKDWRDWQEGWKKRRSRDPSNRP